MTARRLVISGRVQGVGFRDWMVARAQSLGLMGWVRNRTDGTIEALIDGDEPAVAELLRQCRRGPPAAHVTALEETLADPPEDPGFRRRPTI